VNNLVDQFSDGNAILHREDPDLPWSVVYFEQLSVDNR
jgi:hypothetical protein